jgi:hypothetical protein
MTAYWFYSKEIYWRPKKMGCIDRSKVNTPASFPGKKSLSTERFGCGKGKMSSAHGTGKSSASKEMCNASGRIGANKRGFSSGIKPQGPKTIK